MGTKLNPGQYDCYDNAEPDEPMFVLLARDELAPLAVEFWVYLHAMKRGDNPKYQELFKAFLTHSDLSDRDLTRKEYEARRTAEAMITWNKNVPHVG